MKKLNSNQQSKLDLLREYLTTDQGDDGVLLDDNDITYIWNLKKIYFNGTGIVMVGTGVVNSAKVITDRIDNRDINYIYRAAIRGDEDFKAFINYKSVEVQHA